MNQSLASAYYHIFHIKTEHNWKCVVWMRCMSPWTNHSDFHFDPFVLFVKNRKSDEMPAPKPNTSPNRDISPIRFSHSNAFLFLFSHSLWIVWNFNSVRKIIIIIILDLDIYILCLDTSDIYSPYMELLLIPFNEKNKLCARSVFCPRPFVCPMRSFVCSLVRARWVSHSHDRISLWERRWDYRVRVRIFPRSIGHRKFVSYTFCNVNRKVFLFAGADGNAYKFRI